LLGVALVNVADVDDEALSLSLSVTLSVTVTSTLACATGSSRCGLPLQLIYNI
jgi:hypothetical protein